MLPLGWGTQHRGAIWARAVEEFLTGIDWDRCDEAECQLSAERNEDFTEVDPWADQVEEFLNSRQETGGFWPVKKPEILDALEVPRERQDNRAARRVRQIAASLGVVGNSEASSRKNQEGALASYCAQACQHRVNTVSTPRC